MYVDNLGAGVAVDSVCAAEEVEDHIWLCGFSVAAHTVVSVTDVEKQQKLLTWLVAPLLARVMCVSTLRTVTCSARG